jgi:Raf kinase inhibitor-like YbhB/YbcL family protein
MRVLALRIAPLVLALVVTACGCARSAARARMQERAGAQRRAGPAATPAGIAGTFVITTSAFANDAQIPKQYTADGQGISPPLTWGAPPAGTKSLALIVSDPDAPGGTYIHWVVYGIPAAARALPGSVPRGRTRQGENSAKAAGWTPPSPPPGKLHHYRFRLYALDAPVDLAPGATASDLEGAMQGHTLATAEVTGTYER